MSAVLPNKDQVTCSRSLFLVSRVQSWERGRENVQRKPMTTVANVCPTNERKDGRTFPQDDRTETRSVIATRLV
jgi:hypothetical protein